MERALGPDPLPFVVGPTLRVVELPGGVAGAGKVLFLGSPFR